MIIHFKETTKKELFDLVLSLREENADLKRRLLDIKRLSRKTKKYLTLFEREELLKKIYLTSF